MKRLFSISLITMLHLNVLTYAQGDLLITPKRIVFENNKQKEEINLVNTGQDTATYTISFVQYNMKEDGSLVIIQKPDSGQMFADPYLRIFPRRVTLAPREPQVVSLQYRRSADMAEGEYRSHIYFRSEKNNTPLGIENPVNDSSKLKIKLTPVFGLSIPVILRTGQLNVSSSLTNLKFEKLPDLTQALNLTINRTGNSSIYGDIVVQFFPTIGNPVEVGRINNVGVYTNINKRNLTVKFSSNINLELSTGKLKVQYLSKKEKNIVIHAEEEMDVILTTPSS